MPHDPLLKTGLIGSIIAALCCLTPVLAVLLGALGFGGLCAMVLATSMELLQNHLDDRDRLLGFAVFHVVIRGGLALAAMGAGIASDLLDGVSWPLLGRLDSSQVVLLSSGVLVIVVAIIAGRPGGAVADSPPDER